eukprot:148762_1
MDVIKDSLYQYFYKNFKDDMIALYKCWIPALAMMFSVVPMQYRLPFLSTVGLFWLVYLSLYRGEAEEKTQPKTIESTFEIPASIISITQPKLPKLP